MGGINLIRPLQHKTHASNAPTTCYTSSTSDKGL